MTENAWHMDNMKHVVLKTFKESEARDPVNQSAIFQTALFSIASHLLIFAGEMVVESTQDPDAGLYAVKQQLEVIRTEAKEKFKKPDTHLMSHYKDGKS
jgi:hypothetical protein